MRYKGLIIGLLLVHFRTQSIGQEKSISEKYQIRTYAEDGAWLWFNDQHIIMDGKAIYIGAENADGRSAVHLFQSVGSAVKTTAYPLSTWAARDDHNYPALLKLKNGNLLASYSRNPSHKMYYRIATIVSGEQKQQQLNWGPEKVVDLANGMSYNNPIQLSDENNRIYNWYSIFTGSPAILTSDDQGVTWSPDAVYMQAGKNHSSPYLKYVSDGKNRIDLLYTNGHPRNEPENSIYHLYYQNGRFYQSDGRLIKSLKQAIAQPFAPEAGTKIYDGRTEGPGWVWDIAYSKDKHPVAVYISSADSALGNDLRYRYAYWNASTRKWKEHQIAYAGNHLYVPENHFAGGICIDPEDINVVYISANVDPLTGKSLVNKHFQIFRGSTSDDGDNWSWQQLTFDVDRDNLRPVVPQGHRAKIAVFWFSGLYKSSLDFKTKVLGIVEYHK